MSTAFPFTEKVFTLFTWPHQLLLKQCKEIHILTFSASVTVNPPKQIFNTTTSMPGFRPLTFMIILSLDNSCRLKAVFVLQVKTSSWEELFSCHQILWCSKKDERYQKYFSYINESLGVDIWDETLTLGWNLDIVEVQCRSLLGFIDGFGIVAW